MERVRFRNVILCFSFVFNVNTFFNYIAFGKKGLSHKLKASNGRIRTEAVVLSCEILLRYFPVVAEENHKKFRDNLLTKIRTTCL